MKGWGLISNLLATLCLTITVAVTTGHGQSTEEYSPKEGQQGKDVIWVPTPQRLVEKMLDMAKITPQDYLIDLGSGDGRTVIAAAKRGSRAHGIEYNPDMVAASRNAAVKAGVSDKATFAEADLFESDFSQAQVITMFLLPEINLRLRPRILDLKPGTRIVSNSFDMDDWEPDQTEEFADCLNWCVAYLWIVPAKVEGRWLLPDGELALEQVFQNIMGTLNIHGVETPVTGKLNGEQISFAAGAMNYKGRVTGNAMEGTVETGAKWTARRR